MKLISIITPCYNGEEFLKTTYEALKAQTHSNWHWVITDDCSSDSSWQIIQELTGNDDRIKPEMNAKNSGAAVTRNNSIDRAQGDYIAFLDCDDLWHPEKLGKQIEFMENNNFQFTYHAYNMITPAGEVIKEQHPATITGLEDLLKFNPFATSSIMINRHFVEKFAIRFPPHLRRRQDYIFWYKSIKNCDFAQGMEEILSSYRIVGDSSLSANKKKMAIIQWGLYRKEFKLNLFQSLYYFFHYALHGVKKYFL